jgi:creatinine amidohydrolase
MPASPFWSDLSTLEFAKLDWSRLIVVLPVAAIEQHGPHLPVGVDAMIMDRMIARIAARLPQDVRVLFLPVQSVGVSTEHCGFPGTLSLSPATALGLVLEIAEGAVRVGARKLLLLNSHGGNSPLIAQAALELRARRRILAATCSFSRFGYPEGLYEADELRHGIHGGCVETSLMLALRPECVDMGLAENFPVATRELERDFRWLRADRPAGFGWMAQDLSRAGAMGDAAAATAAKGEATADHWTKACVELLQDLDRFDLERLDDPTGL